jgi:hypothetical protein
VLLAFVRVYILEKFDPATPILTVLTKCMILLSALAAARRVTDDVHTVTLLPAVVPVGLGLGPGLGLVASLLTATRMHASAPPAPSRQILAAAAMASVQTRTYTAVHWHTAGADAPPSRAY